MKPLLASLSDAAHDHILDRGRIDPGAFDNGVQRQRAEIDRMPAGKAAVAATTGRPRGFYDECFSHVHTPASS